MSGTLKNRLRSAVRFQLDRLVPKDVQRVFFIVGNGVTRNAVSLTDGSTAGLSWEAWLDGSKALPSGISVAYLRRLGYSMADVFQYAARYLIGAGMTSQYKELWKRLYDSTSRSSPSAVHEAMLAFDPAPTIVTTNFDDLLEMAAPSAEVVSFSTQNVDQGQLLSWPFLQVPKARPAIIKIHGSFFPRSTPDAFQRWWADDGPKTHTVVTREVYEKVAFADKFDDTYRLVLDLLEEPRNLGIMIGLGFGGEELILSRLFMKAARGAGRYAPIVVLTTEAPSDPLFRYERYLPLRAVRIPLGLVASPETRALGWVAALQEIGGLRGKGTAKLGSLDHKIRQKDIAARDIGETTPLVVSIGQISLNRVIGLEDALAQESAYAPNRIRRSKEEFSWGPDGLGGEHVLSVSELGGQSTVPALVWDALAIPTALAARLHADEIGDAIVSRLGETRFLDYHWVLGSQGDPRPENLAKGVPATENATIVTWFGLRTIVDSYRNFDAPMPTTSKVEGFDRSCFELGAPLYYVSKVGWGEIEPKVAALRAKGEKPIIVYDSGGRGAPEREVGIAEAQGVIIASARAALEWLNLSTPRPTTAPVASDFQALRSESNAWSDTYRALYEAKDDRGRLKQVHQFLTDLRTKGGPIPPCLTGWLRGARMFVVTLGDQGSVHWFRSDDGQWKKPRWTRAENPVPLRDIRSGLECGDVSRAGFVASLLASTGFDRKTAPPAEAYDWAAAWLNWFGWHKLRFFALDPYLDFLRKWNWSSSDLRYPGGGIPSKLDLHPDGNPAVGPVILNDELFAGGSLHPDLEKWLVDCERLFGSDRTPWSKQIDSWSIERFGPR
jgi:hypothetical protein